MNEGVTTFDGEIYALPEAANIVNSLMFYNKDILAEAGLDPENPPETWSDFADACKKITEAGGGQYYGLIESGAAAVRTEIELKMCIRDRAIIEKMKILQLIWATVHLIAGMRY